MFPVRNQGVLLSVQWYSQGRNERVDRVDNVQGPRGSGGYSTRLMRVRSKIDHY